MSANLDADCGSKYHDKSDIEERAARELENLSPEKTLARDSASRRLSLWESNPLDRFAINELTDPPPQRHFVVHPYLPEGAAAVLTGAGGTNKTGLVVGRIATAIAAGLVLFGEPVRLGRVLVVTAEDRRDTILRHVWANTRHLSERQRQNVSNNLFAKDTVGTGFLLTRHIDGTTETSPDVGQLIEYAREIEGLRLIVFDTLSRLNGGEETNEDLARFVSAMERVSVETGAATLALHHVGKAQMRADANDQYSSRGGSALSDNARSVLNLSRITPEMRDVPTNASDLVAQGRLLRLSHVKSNYATAATDRYFERIQTPHAARLLDFKPEFASNDVPATWARIKTWMTSQTEVAHPTRATIEALGGSIGSRAAVRRALDWAKDRGHLIEAPHPNLRGGRKTYLRTGGLELDGEGAA